MRRARWRLTARRRSITNATSEREQHERDVAGPEQPRSAAFVVSLAFVLLGDDRRSVDGFRLDGLALRRGCGRRGRRRGRCGDRCQRGRRARGRRPLGATRDRHERLLVGDATRVRAHRDIRQRLAGARLVRRREPQLEQLDRPAVGVPRVQDDGDQRAPVTRRGRDERVAGVVGVSRLEARRPLVAAAVAGQQLVVVRQRSLRALRIDELVRGRRRPVR